MRRRRNRPKNQPKNPGLGSGPLESGPGKEVKELFFSFLVAELTRKDEEDQIIAWLDAVLVQAENFPNLTLGSVSFNGISEFLG
jgi:hypothetical protein